MKFEILFLEKALFNKDSRQIIKIFKSIRKFKKHLKSHHFLRVLECLFPEENVVYLKQFPDHKQDFAETFEFSKNQASKLSKTNEVYLYVHALYVIYLVQIKKLDLVNTFFYHK